MFYVNRAKEGFRRLLLPFYLVVFTIAGSLVSLLLGQILDVLGAISALITLIAALIVLLVWIVSCFVELFTAVDYINKANVIIAESITHRVSSIDDMNKK